MNWTIKLTVPEHRAYDGVLIERQEIEAEIPFACGDTVYYVHRKDWWKAKSPYVVTKCSVTGVWATNIVGVILGGNEHVTEDEFKYLFTNRDAAIGYCLEQNERRKVKIYGE